MPKAFGLAVENGDLLTPPSTSEESMKKAKFTEEEIVRDRRRSLCD